MIKRKIFKELKDHLDKKEITLIVGPRQAGKTTLMVLLKEHLEAQGKKTIFFNLDIEADKQLFVSQEQLLHKIAIEIGESEGYVFIDEIQRKENAGLFLKGLYDMNLPYKLIVSGSGSVELKEKIHESLAGRKRVFELSTLSFIEFVNYKTEYKYEIKLPEFFAIEPNQTQRLLEEYLSYGGYPRVILEDTVDRKRRIMAELYQSYLERDIVSLLGIKKTESFTALVQIMASQVGNLVNVTELSNTLNISTVTVSDYLWYMQKTFLVDKVTPYFRNIRKEITKAPVFYFYDLGMRNYALGTFGTTPISDNGFLFQNFIYHLLKNKTQDSSARVHYWRTTDKAEVDFVIDKVQEVIPIEVKYKKLSETETTRSFQNFLSKYQPKLGYVIHLGKESKERVGNTEIAFLPYSQFLFQDL
ncbi:ATPase [Candidatus Shapirobacteria bacterium CG08_land_8_20_14_0_20_39_18]|uniref:ATPase n=1 Tax=Candidatus Shapirobacteria bacterium CG08_land_8_20_14_0_20_39_18 TaxID=1974883 RepID=A0A2M6XCV1_9BACT|nr:MAG: ATPase [Candidatus Shapirobacteria bacterium CG08_land_8_20_14_0_20_39_18]PIY65132.1 MAG: ATPase [Candidatus Shapirobacteria bacterium CG_4_10_14_0_8_um_filter_39_15]PJE67989.1 MAG: ATPase [Candidatus Shapirobacteria bacterium CG10_big_fil_rev_8_21_14_0_10_38_8]